MKKATMIAMGLMIMAITASLWAADDVKPPKPREGHVRERGMQGMPSRDPNAMKQMMQDSLERRKQEHQAVINELKDIKKMAESEKATKTAEAIQKLIDTREAAFKKQIDEVEKRRAEMKERMEQRRQDATANPAAPKTTK